MPKKQTAFVVVSKSWFDGAMALLVGKTSTSTGDAHLIVGPLDDISDNRGLWLKDFKSVLERKGDGSRVTMRRLMIPWHAVLLVGIVDESVKIPTGFGGTVLTPEGHTE